MGRMLRFTVYGKPAQVGSKKAFTAKRKDGTTVARLKDDNSERQQQWYNAVASRAARESERGDLITGPVRLSITFCFKRPGDHYHKSKKRHGELKETAPKEHTKKPDMDKLIRNTKDALTAVLWQDDCLVCEYGFMRREYAVDGKECAHILIEEID